MARDSLSDELEQLRRRNAELERCLLDFDPEIAGIFRNIQDLFYRADADGRLLIVSPSIFNILGYRPAEVAGWQLVDVYVDPEDRSRLLAAIEQNGGMVSGFEARLQRKDGEVVWVSINSHYYHDADGNIAGIEGTVRDISERIHAQQKYHRILATALDGFWMIDAEDLRIVEVNDRYCEMSGFSREELLDMTIPMLEAVHTEEEIRANVELLIREERGLFESQHRRKNGEIFDVEVSIHYISELGLVSAFMRDISERKRAEAERDASEYKYRTLFESSPDAKIMGDVERGFVDCNQMTLKMFGCRDKESFLSHQPEDFSPPQQPDGRDSKQAAGEEIIKALANGTNSFEWVHKRANGELFPAEVLLTPIRLGGRQMFQSTVRDISERKRAEAERDESERKYRELVKEAATIILRWDTNGCITFFNEYAQKFFGYSEAEILGQNVVGTIVPEQEFTGRDLAKLMKSIQADPASFEYNENENICKNGERVWIAWRNRPYFDDEGNLTEILSVGIDMTARKQADEAILQAHDELERRVDERTHELAKLINEHMAITNTVPDLLYRLDASGNLVWWNQAAELLTGLSPEELRNQPIRKFVVESDIGKAERSFFETIRDGRGEVEVYMHSLEGPRLYHFKGAVFVDETGVQDGTVGIGRDITDQKAAEEKLRHSEQSLAAAQRMAHLGSWSLDLLDNRLEWSDEACRIFEVEPERGASYESFLAVVHPDDREMVNKAYAGSLEGREAYAIEHRLLMKDGRIKYVFDQCETAYDEDGRPLRSVGTTFDITERKQAEEALATLLGEHQLMADSIQDVLYRVNTSIELVWWNKAFQEVLGLSSEEMQNCFGFDLFVEEDRRMVEDSVQEVLEKGSSEVEARMITKDGPRYFSFRGNRLQDTDGNVIGIAGVGRDMTERRAAELKRQQLEAQLFQAQKLESLGTLAGGIAHDFNNVLGGMGINNFLLAKQVSGEKGEYLIERNEQLIDYSKQMIRRLLLFADRRRNDLQTFCLVRLLQESMHMVRLSLKENVRFDVRFPEDDALCMYGDAGQIQQILLNLINNARDAVEAQELPKITLKMKRYTPSATFRRKHPEAKAHHYACLSVRDNGSGISKEDMAHVFDPFFSTKEVGKGTGLGLATVYGTLQAHEGVADISSTPDKGTVVSVYLPLCTRNESLGDSGVRDGAKKGRSELVLLADDDEHLRLASKEVLEDLGYRVVEASNGREAVDLFHRHQDEVALAILDVVMPSMGGVDAASRIRKHAAHLPILFVTGYDMKKELQPEKRPKDSLVRSKPFSAVELSWDIRKLLDGKKTSAC